MIDRKALWISLSIILATVAGLAWRLSLLPDWHQLPLDGPDGGKTVDGVRLFIAPGAAAVMVALLYVRKHFASGTEDDVRAWRRWSNRFAIGTCALFGLVMAYLIARSLGYGPMVDRDLAGRAFLVALGGLIMVAGNVVPKLPGLTMRFPGVQLDPWQQKRHLRFMGKMLVLMGLLMAAIGVFRPLLPPDIFGPFVGVIAVMTAAVFWHRFKMKREPSPQ